MAGYALGIDLGTTYTAAAVARGDRATIVPLGNRAATIPTVVHFAEDGSFKIGEAALPRAIAQPGRVAREFKRRLGDPTPLVLGGTAWSAEALMGEVLRWVADTVTEREGGPPERVALTHPANWGPYKLDLLTQAVRLAGLKVDRYLSEPEAAAFAYAFDASERLPADGVIAVYDLGGGTFDATVLRVAGDGFEILGNPEGIERLGGIDVDETVFAHVRSALGDAMDDLDPMDPATTSLLARLRADCVAAKEQLSNDAEVSVPVTLPNLQTEVRITRAELEQAITAPLEQSVAALRRALTSSGVEPEQLHAVLLVGGSSRMPIVADLVSCALGRPVAVDAHPKHGVAVGAALAARGTVPAAEPVASAAVTRSLPVEPPAAPPSPPTDTPAPEPADRPSSVPTARSSVRPNTTRLLLGAVAALLLIVVGLGAFLLGGGGNEPRTVITAAPGAVAPTGLVSCPDASVAAVCIDQVAVEDGRLVVSFTPQQTELAAPVDGEFPEGTVHPLFFFDETGPALGREWGPTSPFSGTSPAGFEGYRVDDVPHGAKLCSVLIDENRQWIEGTGNCVDPFV